MAYPKVKQLPPDKIYDSGWSDGFVSGIGVVVGCALFGLMCVITALYITS